MLYTTTENHKFWLEIGLARSVRFLYSLVGHGEQAVAGIV